jgi:hypothetical protein
MWYVNKQNDAYLIKDLVALKMSDSDNSDNKTVYEIRAFSENQVGVICDYLILEIFSTRGECLTFIKWFLSNYIIGTTSIEYHNCFI